MPHRGGDPKESAWPSSEPSGDKGLYIFRDGRAVKAYRAPAAEPVAPAIHCDTMPLQLHPSNGQPVDSRTQFKRIMKAHGHEERTGADRVASNIPVMKNTSEDDYIRDVKIATEQVQAGTAPLSEYDRAVCKRINEQLKNKA